MERWAGKVAVVTGASAGLGATIVKDLVKSGMIVVGLARRKERVEALKADIPSNATGKLYAVKCDVSNDSEVVEAFAWIARELGAIHVLVNNAGIVHGGSITDEGNEADLQNVMRTNVWGLIHCTKKAVEIMKRHKVIGAHIIHINSIAGHAVPAGRPNVKPRINVYAASKFAVTALTETLRQEFNYYGNQYKMTSISPGVIRTEVLPAEMYKLYGDAVLNPEDISNAVLYVLGTAPHVQIHELTIKPVGEMM